MELGQTLKLVMLITLGILSFAYIFRWARNVRNDRKVIPSSPESSLPTLGQGALGFATNFFDTLGIGSFATTTAVFKLLRMVRDEYIPGTLLAAFAVKSLSLDAIRWLVVVVIVYTAAMMLRAAFAEWRTFTTPMHEEGKYVAHSTD